ncbi:GNAT family N-acetyltransferase [Undibacterium sp. Di27W]|uniref:GNAT family N-acetyltransferase n=1 Tax=Undibacterium sp. Di27W TaxID=3413036 RepID=UPI003BF19843
MHDTNIRIQVATSADAATILAMTILFRNHLERIQPSDQQFAAFIPRLLASQDASFFLAYIADEALGYILLRYRDSMWVNGKEATVEDLFVDPAKRKNGIGRALVAHALAHAEASGCVAACLDTNEFNLASTRIYRDLGFNDHSQRWNGRQVFFRKALTSTATPVMAS